MRGLMDEVGRLGFKNLGSGPRSAVVTQLCKTPFLWGIPEMPKQLQIEPSM